MYTVLAISDGYRKFPFLFDGKTIYVPDYNPEAYGKRCGYRLNISTWGAIPWQVDPQRPELKNVWWADFDARGFIAIPPFRYGGHTYRQAVETNFYLPWGDTKYYVDLQPLVYGTDEIDPEYDGAQGVVWNAGARGSGGGSLEINIVPTRVPTGELSMVVKANQEDMIGYLKGVYGGEIPPTINPKKDVCCEMALVDDDNIYWIQKDVVGSNNEFVFDLSEEAGWFFNFQHQYISNLSFVAVLHVVIHADENEMHVDVKSDPLPLTEQLYAELLERDKKAIDITDMNVTKPRVINKTIQKTVIMNAQSDSKANIVQPVFFRTRELAQIIIHPEVTENICINLDAYKSQVERFYIKIEGVAFEEIGRVESGVIFKVKGNLLPGTSAVGTYYILNEDAELVTTGKYAYDR